MTFQGKELTLYTFTMKC